jgi:hypothetical protein
MLRCLPAAHRGGLILGVAGGLTAVMLVGTVLVPNVEIVWKGSSYHGYMPSAESDSDGEIVLVFIGSPTCPWSNIPGLSEVIEEIKMKARDNAAERGLGFSVIGVSIGSHANQGIAFLAKFGQFDEIIAGPGWRRNTGALRFVEGELPGASVTPQLLLLERRRGPRGGIQEEVILGRFVGYPRITAWAERGAPLSP